LLDTNEHKCLQHYSVSEPTPRRDFHNPLLLRRTRCSGRICNKSFISGSTVTANLFYRYTCFTMKNIKLYILAKKIHRLLVFIILILGFVMTITGISLYSGSSSFFIRTLHHQLSILFSLILGLMSLSGLYLFLFPYLR